MTNLAAGDTSVGSTPGRRSQAGCGRACAARSGAGPPRGRCRRGSIAGGRCRSRHRAWFVCQEKTSVSGRQFDDAERHSFLVPYLSNKIQESIFPRQPVKTVAYLRVSTAQQDVRSQRLAILEYTRIQDFPIDNFIEATASGQASEKRRRLDELMSVLQRGDRLVVSELSRLGRSLGQIVAILDALAKAGVAFVAIKENIRVEGKHDIQTMVMTTLFALFAEVERDLISERTREGLAEARSSGTKLGVQEGRSASRKARSPRSPASPDRLSTTSSAREASSRIASVYFYTNLVSTLMTGSPRPGTQAKTKRPVFRFGNHFRTTRAHRGRLVVRSSE